MKPAPRKSAKIRFFIASSAASAPRMQWVLSLAASARKSSRNCRWNSPLKRKNWSNWNWKAVWG